MRSEENSDATPEELAAPARSGSNAIAERGDLSPSAGCLGEILLTDEAGYDTKYSRLSLFEQGTAGSSWAQQGPSHDQQPAFKWSSSPFSHIPHVGQPDVFDYNWVLLGSGAGDA